MFDMNAFCVMAGKMPDGKWIRKRSTFIFKIKERKILIKKYKRYTFYYSI